MCYTGVQRWVLRKICSYLLVSLFFLYYKVFPDYLSLINLLTQGYHQHSLFTMSVKQNERRNILTPSRLKGKKQIFMPKHYFSTLTCVSNIVT